MAGGIRDKELNLMLIGQTGDGKSATGNTVLGYRVFMESSGMISKTKDVVSKFTRFDNITVKVVDCPGFMGTDMDSGEDKKTAALNMAKALGMCNGGVDAFILVIKRERFTDDKRKSIEALKKIFGNEYMQHLIVVVTGGDMFKEDMEYEQRGKITFKEWCSTQKGAFKQLFDDFSDRFLLINNREKDPQKVHTQRGEIIQLADNLRKRIMAGSTMQKELNLMLIGKTGEGKSATGNTILGNRVFTESSGTTSETKDVANKFAHFDNFPIKVVDCPGLMDTDKDSGEDKRTYALHMAAALGMCDGGIDAFILVIKRERFTEDQNKSLDALKNIFGDRYKQHLLVVVSGGDKFKEDMKHEGRGDISFKEWCSKERGSFKQLFNDFSDRFLLINNRETDPEKHKTQRRQIIQLADSLRKLNGRYTSESFKEAKATRDKLIVQENLPMLNESLQRKVGLLTADLLSLKKAPSDRERESILQSLEDLKNEIIEKDKGTGLLKHLMANVKQVKIALHDVDKLHRLAEEMENIREAQSSWSRYGKIATGVTVVAGIGAVAAFVTLAVVAAPVAVGLAVAAYVVSATGSVVGASGTVVSAVKEYNLSTSEEQTGAEINDLDRKVTKAIQDIKN